MLKLDIGKIGLTGSHILCAVSGGADSVALMCLLASARDEGKIALSAAHFEHGIRGESSVQDMEFVKELCGRLNVPLYISRADIPAESERCGEGLESCARRLRHEFLERTRAQINADFIATAHHRRDRAETVLMHLLRGGGINGAASMGMFTGRIVRPLIDIPPEDLRSYLNEIGQNWREDATNLIPDNPRNALRLNVFPLLDDIYPGFEKALTRFSDISADENAYLNEQTDGFIQERVTFFADIAIIPTDAPLAILRRAIKRFLDRECSFDDTERARTVRGMTDIGSGIRAYGENGKVYIIPPIDCPEPVSPVNGARLVGICRMTTEACDPVPIKNNGLTQVVNAQALEGCVLRLRRDADRIAPFGMGGKSKLLSDVFTDKKIPLPLRDRVPVIARENEVIWAAGVALSEKAKVTPNTKAIKLSIEMEENHYDA